MPSPMASQDSVDQLTRMIAQMQQTIINMQASIYQLQVQLNLPASHPSILQDPGPKHRRGFTPLKMSLTEAFEKLIAAGHLQPRTPTPPPDPLPLNYNTTLFCKYHQGHGHITNNCLRLRHAIQDLIDAKKIALPNSMPNVITNPLSHHNNIKHINNFSSNAKKVNVIDTRVLQNPGTARQSPRYFTPLGMSLSEALDRLMSTKHLTLLPPTPPPESPPRSYNPSQYCKYHQGHGHVTNNCFRLRHAIQDLIDANKLHHIPSLNKELKPNLEPEIEAKLKPQNQPTIKSKTKDQLEDEIDTANSTALEFLFDPVDPMDSDLADAGF